MLSKLSFLLLLLVAVVGSIVGVGASNVVDLTKTKDFDNTIGKGKGALVEFFAPWCGHCKNLAPTYESLADAFAPKAGKSAAANDVIIAKVDGDSNRDLGKRYGISGFPTLRWFPNDSSSLEDSEVYSGPRTLDELAKFVTAKSGAKSNIKPPPPPASVQLNADNFNKVAHDPKKNVLVEFYAPWCGHCKNLAPIYEKVAKTFENEPDCVVAQFNADAPEHKAIGEEYGVQGYPTLMFFPKALDGTTDKFPRVCNAGRTEEALLEYLNSNCGTHRTLGGGLTNLAGRLPALDALASKWYAAPLGSPERSDILSQAKHWRNTMLKAPNVSGTPDKDIAAQYYLRVMDKITESGDEGYLEKEAKRLSGILKKHADGINELASKKVDELTRKVNILNAFTDERVKKSVKASEEKAKEQAAKKEKEAAASEEHTRDEL